ncbi:MAG TPA: hypothetical protein VLF59_05245 [Candidatus Saccharimonadales bacterium]|nr:hypothetical protein [Candidatus Saccharimonadales bacterium]
MDIYLPIGTFPVADLLIPLMPIVAFLVILVANWLSWRLHNLANLSWLIDVLAVIWWVNTPDHNGYVLTIALVVWLLTLIIWFEYAERHWIPKRDRLLHHGGHDKKHH